MLKKLSALIIAITIILVNTNCVNASVLDIGTVATGLNGAFNLADSNEKKRSDISNWLHQNSDWAGFLFDPVSMSGFLTPSVIYSVLPQSIKDQISDSSDDSEVLNKTIDMILEGQSVSGNNVTNNTNVNTFIKNVQSDYVSNYRSFVYTYKLNDCASYIRSTAEYLDFKKIIDNNIRQGWNYLYAYYKDSSQYTYIGVIDLDLHPYFCFLLRQIYPNNNYLSVLYYDSDSATQITQWDKLYKWNPSISEYQFIAVEPMNLSAHNMVAYEPNTYYTGVNNMHMPIITTVSTGFRYFSNVASMTPQNVLYQPYYYNNDVWQDFSTTSGDYTFSPSNINTVTYGDTNTYIDSFNTEEGYPPSIPEINNYINQQNEQNVNTGGGSGGGSGDGSGGNGDGIGSIGDVFGWLKQLGAFIASLIKGIGEFLTEIIGGLIEAITDILSGISSLISNVTELLPTAFMDFLSACFSWMPSEWIGLISASLLFMLLWGIIKTIRGN